MKQSTAVKNAIMSVLSSKGVNYELNGETPVSKYKDLFKDEVHAIICEGFKSGEIDMSAESKIKYNEESELKKYVTGLINNWVKKAPEFNGGDKYTPANPGSRTGMQDETVKALRALKGQTTDPKVLAEIEAALEKRLAEIKPKQEVTIDVNALPEHLRHLVK